MSTKLRVKVRKFLNGDPTTRAFIIATVEDTRGRTPSKKERLDISPTLDIGDCSRAVSLDFDVHSYYHNRNHVKTVIKRNIKKARLLRDTLVDFTAALEAEYALFLKREPLRRKLDKEKKKTKG